MQSTTPLHRTPAILFVIMLLAAWPARAGSERDIVERYRVKDGLQGVVLVGVGRDIRQIHAIGSADIENAVPMRPGTRFEIGSLSKWIASIAVLKLVDQGRLDLDAPVVRYLPEYRPDTGARLSLRRLMSHASGLPNQMAQARKDLAAGAAAVDQAEAVRRYASGDLAFEPGTAWDYSHSNWVLVKAVVERVAGMPYAAWIDSMLIQPLTLSDTGIFEGDSSRVRSMAIGYETIAPQPRRKPAPVPDFMAMAGGFYTSAPDLLRIMDAVLSGTLLTPASRTALVTVLMPEQHYALGGRVRVERIGGQDRRTAWEDGANGAFRMVARRVLADGHTVIVLSNASVDPARLGALASELLDASYRRR